MQSKDEKINKALGFLKDAKDFVHRAEQILNEVDKAPVLEEKENIKESEVNDLSKNSPEEIKKEDTAPSLSDGPIDDDEPKAEADEENIPGLEDFSNKSQDAEKSEIVDLADDDEEEEVTFKPVEPDHDLANDVLDRPSVNAAVPEENNEEQPAAQGVKELDI